MLLAGSTRIIIVLGLILEAACTYFGRTSLTYIGPRPKEGTAISHANVREIIALEESDELAVNV